MPMLGQYFEGIRKEFRYFPSWPPNAPYKLGDVGQVIDGEFNFVTSLAALDIRFETRNGQIGQNFSHTSDDGVEIKFKAAGKTREGVSLPEAEAGAQIEFKSAGAFVFQLANATVHLIEDQYALSRDILAKFATVENGRRKWEPDWFVVTEVVTAEKSTILISDTASARFTLGFKGDVPTGPVPLATASGDISFNSESGMVTKFLAEAGLTPLIGLKRVKRGLLARLLGRDDWATFQPYAGADQVPGLPANILEVPSAEEWVPMRDKNGDPLRGWRPKPAQPSNANPQAPPPATPPVPPPTGAASR